MGKVVQSTPLPFFSLAVNILNGDTYIQLEASTALLLGEDYLPMLHTQLENALKIVEQKMAK